MDDFANVHISAKRVAETGRLRELCLRRCRCARRAVRPRHAPLAARQQETAVFTRGGERIGETSFREGTGRPRSAAVVSNTRERGAFESAALCGCARIIVVEGGNEKKTNRCLGEDRRVSADKKGEGGVDTQAARRRGQRATPCKPRRRKEGGGGSLRTARSTSTCWCARTPGAGPSTAPSFHREKAGGGEGGKEGVGGVVCDKPRKRMAARARNEEDAKAQAFGRKGVSFGGQ